MNKWILSLMVLVAGATLSFGETDYIANERIDNILDGDEIGVLYKAADITATDDVTATDDLIVGDDASFADDVTVTGTLTKVGADIETQGAVTATNGYIIPATLNTYVLQLGAASNVISLPTPASAGQELFIICNSTNIMQFNEGAKLQAAGDYTMGIYDTFTLVSMTTQWLEKARSNN